MAYTPELSLESSQTLRRIAWALDKPMTQTLEIVMRDITLFINPQKVCEKCKDDSLCSVCIFSPHNHQTFTRLRHCKSFITPYPVYKEVPPCHR